MPSQKVAGLFSVSPRCQGLGLQQDTGSFPHSARLRCPIHLLGLTNPNWAEPQVGALGHCSGPQGLTTPGRQGLHLPSLGPHCLFRGSPKSWILGTICQVRKPRDRSRKGQWAEGPPSSKPGWHLLLNVTWGPVRTDAPVPEMVPSRLPCRSERPEAPSMGVRPPGGSGQKAHGVVGSWSKNRMGLPWGRGAAPEGPSFHPASSSTPWCAFHAPVLYPEGE